LIANTACSTKWALEGGGTAVEACPAKQAADPVTPASGCTTSREIVASQNSLGVTVASKCEPGDADLTSGGQIKRSISAARFSLSGEPLSPGKWRQWWRDQLLPVGAQHCKDELLCPPWPDCWLDGSAVRDPPDFKPATPRSPLDDVVSWPKADPFA
jgi:hypothetical protein